MKNNEEDVVLEGFVKGEHTTDEEVAVALLKMLEEITTTDTKFGGRGFMKFTTDDDGKTVTQSERFTVTGNFVSPAGGKSRFARINAIIGARNSRDKSKSVELLNEYVKNEFAISQLFREI